MNTYESIEKVPWKNARDSIYILQLYTRKFLWYLNEIDKVNV